MHGPVSAAQTWIEGSWHAGDPPILGARGMAVAMSMAVFDGARAFEGVIPDLEAHCARVVESARVLHMKPELPAGAVAELAREGVARFPAGSALYIRPSYYIDAGFLLPEPGSTRFVLSLYESPLPAAAGLSACITGHRRPGPEAAPTLAKASALYPQSVTALIAARQRGYDNAVMLDPSGYVAEFATANLFLVRDGVVHTPAVNGTFLDGITRRRVIQLLRRDGLTVIERPVHPRELAHAHEVFSCGNYGKVVAVTRIDDHDVQPGPVTRRARDLYWSFAHGDASLTTPLPPSVLDFAGR